MLQIIFICDLGKPGPHKNIQVYAQQLLQKKNVQKMLESFQIPHRAV